MKKKILSILLACAMVMAFMPTLAFADAEYVASVGGTNYTTLLKAMDAAESGDTVTLLADADAGRGICTFGNIELELNGYSLTVPAGVEVEVLSGTLTLCNTSGEGKIVNNGMIKVYDEAVLDISKLIYSQDTGLVAGHPGSVAIQNGGTLVSIPAWHEANPGEIEKDSTDRKFFYGTQTGAKYVVKDKTYYCISTDGNTDHSWRECDDKPLAVFSGKVFYDLESLAKAVNKAANGKKDNDSIQFIDNVDFYENPFEKDVTITTGGSEQVIWLNENFIIDGITVTFEGTKSGPLNVESWLEEEEQSPILVYPQGVLNIKDDVVLRGGSSNLGGMIYIADEGQVFMSGGEISGCSANKGGAVYDAGLFEMTGGVIKDNQAKFGGGVYIEFNDEVQGKLRLSKDAYIYDNTKTSKKSQNNVYLPNNGDKWTNAELEFFGSCTSKAKVGVTSETTPVLKGKVAVAENATWNDFDAVVADDAGLELTFDESTIYLCSGNRIKALIEKALKPENIKAALFGGIVTDIIQNIVKSAKVAIAMHYAALKPFLRPLW